MSGNGNVVPIARTQPPSVSFAEMQRLAESIAKSGLFGMKTADQALALMAIAQAEGRHPALAARDYSIIQGRPAKNAEAMMRDFLDSGGRVEWHALSDSEADATFSHPAGGSARIRWDMARAQTAGLQGKDNWRKYPRQMLRSRVVSEGVRTVCPMATSGMYVPEEVADFETRAERAVDVTPPLPAAPPPPEPPHDPETGEVKPHAIPMVLASGTDQPNWLAWGSQYIAAIKTAASHAEIDEWERLNRKPRREMPERAPKANGSVERAIASQRAKLGPEPEIIGPEDAGSVLAAAQ